jgi:hypothetical protein
VGPAQLRCPDLPQQRLPVLNTTSSAGNDERQELAGDRLGPGVEGDVDEH